VLSYHQFNAVEPKGGEIMERVYSKLIGRIAEKVGTQGEFAARMNLSERSVSLKLNGKVGWKQEDIVKACAVLDIPATSLHDYFFASTVQND
jgi:hypothetical protein